MRGELRRLTAFTGVVTGGNPAGVWVGDELPPTDEMQRIAAEVGYSETAFFAPASGTRRTVRYYSPEREVTFCGHATIASGVVLGDMEGPATYVLETLVGEVPVAVEVNERGTTSSLTSVATEQRDIPDAVLAAVLDALRWTEADLSDEIPPKIAYAGAWHLVLAVADRSRLGTLDYDFDALRDLMLENDLTTLQLIWKESDTLFHSRNPFPVGGVVEDPATGASAVALGGYLRDAGLMSAPFEITIHQGYDMGRPSVLQVQVPAVGGIVVSGTAVEIPADLW